MTSMGNVPDDASELRQQAVPVVVAIDDDTTFLLATAKALTSAGMVCHTATTGEAGLRLIRECAPDLVLLDILLIGEDGFTLCREIRRTWSPEALPVIMVTGLEDLESINAAYQSGANDFLAKPLHWKHLPFRISHVLQAGRAITERKRVEAEKIELEATLRRSEALRRVILDSLHTHVAVINAKGDIIVVNEPWRRFAFENGAQALSSVAEGVNYLEVVRRSATTGDPLAEEVLQGIQDVLDEQRSTFEADYPCDSPAGQRWFHMQITRLEGRQGGAVFTHENITERKQAEEALRISEERFTKIFQMCPDAIDLVRTTDRVCTDLNRAFTNLFGYTPEDFISKPLLPEDLDLWVNREDRDRLMASVKEYGEALALEIPLRRKDGSIFLAQISTSAMEINGTPYHLSITRDITERKRALRALLDSEERYQRITEAITDYIYTVRVTDGYATETRHGPGCLTVTGYHANEFANDPFLWYLMVATEDRPRVEEQVRRILAGEDPPPIEHRIVHKNRTVRWVRNTFVPHRDEQGALVAYDGLLQDITEQKQAEGALRSSEALLRLLFENAPLGMAIVDSTTGQLLSVNPRLGQILGYAPEELLNRTFQSISHPDHLAEDLGSIRELILGTVSEIQKEKRYLHRSGKIVWSHLSVVRLPSAPGDPPRHISLVEDITERKQAEAERHKLAERITQVQKLEALGTLVAGVAHNFNNILAVIMGAASLREGLTTHTEDVEAYRLIDKACRRGRDVVKSLISFAKPSLLHQAPLDLHVLIREVRVLLENTTRNRIEIIEAFTGEPLWVLGDAGNLNHAIMNICLNSLGAMPNGGALTFRTTIPERDWVEVSVEDSGEGMTPEVLVHVLEPFFTTKAVDIGMGLGLSLTYGVIKAHRGSMEIASVLGKGTTVKLRFPRILAPIAPAQGVELLVPSLGRMKMLFVDDDNDIRDLVAWMLEVAGCLQVKVAASGKEALESLRADFLPNLIILDQNMPGMNGVETMEQIRALHLDMPILISSGQPDIETWDCFKQPNVAVISKPFAMDELLAKLAYLAKPL